MIQSSSIQRLASWGSLAVTAALMIGMLLLERAGCQFLFNPSADTVAESYGIAMLPLNALGFAILGALITHFRPDNRIGWVSSLFGFGFMLGVFGIAYGECGLSGPLALPFPVIGLWLEYFANFSTIIGLGLFPMLFPDGKFLTKRMRRIGLALFWCSAALAVLLAFWPGPLPASASREIPIENPLALPIAPDPFWQNIVTQGETLVTMGFVLTGIVFLIVRWRRSSGEVRQQIKWLTYFLATAGTMFISVEFIGEIFYPPIFEGWFYLAELAVFWLGFPVVFGLAIFKYRLYDIDIIIRRTLSYALLTGVLAAIYFGAVVLMQSVVGGLTGDASSPIVTVLSTLAIAALFNPLRLRIQDFIDRRFYRTKYVAEQTLADFAATARDQVDMDLLVGALIGVVQDTMQPERASLWLREGE